MPLRSPASPEAGRRAVLAAISGQNPTRAPLGACSRGATQLGTVLDALPRTWGPGQCGQCCPQLCTRARTGEEARVRASSLAERGPGPPLRVRSGRLDQNPPFITSLRSPPLRAGDVLFKGL